MGGGGESERARETGDQAHTVVAGERGGVQSTRLWGGLCLLHEEHSVCGSTEACVSGVREQVTSPSRENELRALRETTGYEPPEHTRPPSGKTLVFLSTFVYEDDRLRFGIDPGSYITEYTLVYQPRVVYHRVCPSIRKLISQDLSHVFVEI